MGGTLGDLLGASYFNNLSPIHDCDAGGEIAYDRHRMRDEEVGQSEVALQLRQQVDDLGANADVERGDGFVAHDEPGAKGEGSGYADALPLSAGEFMGVAAEGGFVEAHGAQEFETRLRRSSFARPDNREPALSLSKGRLSPHESP